MILKKAKLNAKLNSKYGKKHVLQLDIIRVKEERKDA